MSPENTGTPLFVVGIWRSGTSLLYSLLNQHPQISLMYEGDLPLLGSLFADRNAKRDWLERWEFWNSAPSRHHLNPELLRDRQLDMQDAAQATWRQYAAGAHYFGEKSPSYYNSLQFLADRFPGARFIIIWRDLSSTCRSILKARESSSFFRKRGILHRTIIGYRRMKQQCDALREQGVPVHQLHYEDLVRYPHAVMTRVCEFLQVPFDPRMTSLADADRSAIYNAAHHEAVKTGAIQHGKSKTELLPPSVRSKIAGYIALWHEQTQGAWPVHPLPQDGTAKISNAQQIMDSAAFQLLWWLDRFTAFVYCHLPISLLRGYRALKQRKPRKQPLAVPLSESSSDTGSTLSL